MNTNNVMITLCAASLAVSVWASEPAPSEFATTEDCWSPAAFTVLPGLEMPQRDWSITGLRINLFAGRHQNVLFLSVSSLADLVTDDMNGLQVAGLCNHIGRSSGSLQVAGFVNSVDRDFSGLQVAGLYSAVNGSLTGASIAAMTRTDKTEGLQIGVFNMAKTLHGLQVGVVNIANDGMEGFQIGLLNVMKDGRYPAMLIFNAGF